jgi:hypothetical protein
MLQTGSIEHRDKFAMRCIGAGVVADQPRRMDHWLDGDDVNHLGCGARGHRGPLFRLIKGSGTTEQFADIHEADLAKLPQRVLAGRSQTAPSSSREIQLGLRANSLIHLDLRTLLLPQRFLEPVPNVIAKTTSGGHAEPAVTDGTLI